jgi:TonB family protein
MSPTLRGFMRNSQISVRLKAKIDEQGNVTVLDAQGENVAVNNAVKAAVERWKFAPAVDQTGPRCVDTEIPIIVGP